MDSTSARPASLGTPTHATSDSRLTYEAAATATTTAGAIALQGVILALVRIAVGFFWYQESFFKLPGHTAYFGNLLHMVAKGAIMPGYAGIIEHVFVPHAALFAIFVWLLELSLGISLMFGLFTRLGGTIGAIWAALLFCGLAYGGRNSLPWYFGLLVLINVLLAVTAAGRTLGVDRWLRPRLLTRAARGERLAAYGARAA
ncbi:MAG TPA: TQO small subunit DoxD [Ktedonobacterales bacterium]